MAMSGDLSYGGIYVESYQETSHYHEWSITFPDTTESVVFPKIADSLGQAVNNYSRSDFQISRIYMSDYEKLGSHADYLTNWYGSTEPSWGKYYEKYFYLIAAEKEPIQEKQLPADAEIINKEFEYDRSFILDRERQSQSSRYLTQILGDNRIRH